ncbi:hypothetical protein SD427_17875 [Chryseobacterium sp. JJR-5R]|uniref:hypothetical protein n=1 Tax=Chryseobacterium sp. JJR-5R TaxID=3093923 RepID=UPI002A766254|nr:hypothetical protein [Chryseobacterium sp. JJR-5R]WPO82607.1 hypothetical protein SD427_17875 [Chryseobacterium sp. JJR-5R]
MSTTKNNMEYQIKKQMNEREITPSRDLWSEIETHTQVYSSKPKINRFMSAACLVLALSLSAVLFFNRENNNPVQHAVTEKADLPADRANTENRIIQSPESVAYKPEESVATENKSQEKMKIQKLHAVSPEKEKLVVKDDLSEAQPAEADLKVLPEKIFARADSAKIPLKRKRYVDPSTLLFSVEHKDAIQKSRETSNVASVEISGN